jgi:hypothetical protein
MRFQIPAGRRATAGASTSTVLSMRSALSLRALRAAVLGAVLSIGALAGASRDAAAQTVTVRYEDGCGPSTNACSLVQFEILNDTGALLELNSLTLFTLDAAFAFTPQGPTTVNAIDDFLAPFPSEAVVDMGGNRIAIDFLNPGPFPFTLSAGNTGFLELQLSATPSLQTGAFTFTGQTATGATIDGTVTAASVVPEPSTYVLMATGMGALGLLARRRRTR